MREMVGMLVVVLALAVAANASAQSVSVRTVDFDEAIRRALERNPTIDQAATAIARSEAILQQARAVTLPSASARVTSVTLDTAQGFEDGVIQPRHQLAFGGSVSVPVLARARWAARAQARDGLEIATRATTQVRQQVAVAAGQAYLAVIRSQRQVEVEERALETARAHLDYAERRLEGGIGSRLNMLRAAQEAMVGEARLENAELALRRSREALGVLLAEDGPVDTAGEPVFAVPAAVEESAWRTRRPDLLTRNAVFRAAQRVVQDSWKDVAPAAEASFEPQYIMPAGLFQPARTWRFTVSLTQPLFLGGLQRGVTREREAVVEASRFALTDLEIQARTEVRLARASVSSLARSLASTRRAADQADEVLRITTIAFEAGASTNIEVIDAQRSARDAETAVALTQNAVQQARLDLLVAVGQFPQ